MSCNTCQAKFTFFTKNVGCPNCGFSYCNKCLKYKCDTPNIGRKKVCGPCYNKLNKMKKSNPEPIINDVLMSDASKEPLAPIDITMKLNSLENPSKPPIVIYEHTSHWDKLKKGLEPADQQIVDRLQKLKDEKNVTLPTIEEIKQRLALLKDQDPEASMSNVINIHQMDTRTDQEKADDLIQEYLAQMELPSTSDPCKKIQDRLNLLQDKNDETCIDQDKEEKIDDDEKLFTKDELQELIVKVSALTAENPNIEDEAVDEDEDEDEDENENECMMCSQTENELGLYKCTGCNNELYCPTCFESSHDEIEIMDKHKAIRFIKQNKKNKEGTLSSAKKNLIQKLLSDYQKNAH